MNDVFELELKVRDYECDMQGIVNNSVYLSYLEHTRHEFFASKGVSFKSMIDEGFIAMVSHIDISFKSPLKGSDRFLSKIALEKKGPKLVFHQEIYQTIENRLCITAKVEAIVTINGKLSRGEYFNQFLK